MIKSWETKKLGELCENLDSKRKPITKNIRKKGDIPYYGATGIVDYVKDFIFNEKLVLLGEDGAKWKASDECSFIINGKTWVNNHAHVLRPNRKIICDEWLVYNLNFQDLTPFVSGMTVPKLNQGKMNEIIIPLPSLSEQKLIVAKLDKAFEAIDKAKTNAEQNLKNAKELFESYLQSVFEKNGEGWEERNLEDCFRLKSGDGLTSKKMNNSGKFSVFGGNGIAGLHDKFNLSGSNVIIGRVGALCGNVRHIKENIWLTDNAFKVTEYKYDFDNSFLTYLLNFKNLRSYARQAAQPVISNSSLKDVILNFPNNLEKQKSIANKFDALSEETKRLEEIYKKKIEDLDELKKSILNKAFSGELIKVN